MVDCLNVISNIQFDGTFYTVPAQFYQLWTIFVTVGRRTLPALHCLITSKPQELYQTILEKIRATIPQFKPLTSMSDWEAAAREVFKEVYPGFKFMVAGSILPSEYGLKLK